MPNLIYGSTLGYNLNLTRRTTFQVTFTVFTAADYATEYDLDGCSVFAEIRKKDEGAVYLDLDPVISDPTTDGEITIDVFLEETLNAGNYKWDMLLVAEDGVRTYLVKGDVVVAPSITDEAATYERGPSGINLQQRIDATDPGGATRLPYGFTNITSTISCPNKAGLVVSGDGTAWDMNSDLKGSWSSILWTTTNTTTPMIDVRGVNSEWSNFALHGDTKDDTYNGRPTAGILCSYDAGLGSGKHTFKNLTIERCAAAIQAGEGSTDSNCDSIRVERCRFKSCDKGFYVKNSQCLDCLFDQCLWTTPVSGESTNPAMFHYEAGGGLTANKCTVVDICDVLRLSQVNEGGLIGHNNGLFVINDLKVDTLAIGTTLLNCDVTSAEYNFMPVDVHFQNAMVSGNSSSYEAEAKYIAKLSGGCKLFLHACKLQPDMTQSILWDTANSDVVGTSVIIENCSIRGISTIQDMFDIEFGQGNIKVVAKNNWSDGVMLADYSGTIEGQG